MHRPGEEEAMMRGSRTALIVCSGVVVLNMAFPRPCSCRIVGVGPGMAHATIRSAADGALPGDTIAVHATTLAGSEYLTDLRGSSQAWIVIMAAGGEVRVAGGNEGWHLTDPAYVRIEGIVFSGQTGNGVNVDDGGSYESPAHDIVFERCTFRDMDATGNNDLLKLSGVDRFTIRECTFLNGSEGGSGLDMVGCHQGTIERSRFENMGSNAIQTKGGSRDIVITRNRFTDCGLRSLNLGGSTGLAYFRPDTARFEAADIGVYTNVFVGSRAPVAYVGCTGVEVVNNTLYRPGRWAIRILQETVDPSRFVACGDNTFVNNIVYLDNSITTECNVGPNTRPETFTFESNLWYHAENATWSGPALPVTDPSQITGRDPLFVDPEAGDFSIGNSSPAAGAGTPAALPSVDFPGTPFATPRSVGAYEATGSAVAYSLHQPGPHRSARPTATSHLFDIRGRMIGAGRVPPGAAATVYVRLGTGEAVGLRRLGHREGEQ
jgi:hypothetical protein